MVIKKLGNFAVRMKQILILILFIYCVGSVTAQQKDSVRPPADSNGQTQKSRSSPAEALLSKDTNKGAATKTIAKKVVDSGRAAKTGNSTGNASATKKDSTKPANSVTVRKTAQSDTSAKQNVSSTSSGTTATAAPAPKETHLLRDKLQAEAIYRHAHGMAPVKEDYLPVFLKGKSTFHPTNGGVQVHSSQDRDYLFYCFLGIAMLLGLIKMLFPKYFNQIFWFFLHPNDRKKNQSEQISGQNIIPSLLLNLFFAITGGLFLSEIFKPSWPGASFWRNWIIFSCVLITVYLIKFLVIKLSGWLFNSPVAASTYNNVVFSINKVIGLLLLPATILIAYGSDHSTSFAYSFAIILIAILLIYRYIASFLLIKGKLKVNAFHFILYLCAVEIIPLLLVYKVLFNNIGQLI